jgi:hypothetical protein
MPNLYFCQSDGNPGMLRAVLSWEAGSALLRDHSAVYVGQEFPGKNGTGFAVLRVFDDEADKDWRSGFYRLAGDVMQIEEALRDSAAKPT